MVLNALEIYLVGCHIENRFPRTSLNGRKEWRVREAVIDDA